MLSRAVFITKKKNLEWTKKKKKNTRHPVRASHIKQVEQREVGGGKYVPRKQISGKNKNTQMCSRKHAKNTYYKLFTTYLNGFPSKYRVIYYRPNDVSTTWFIQNDFYFF